MFTVSFVNATQMLSPQLQFNIKFRTAFHSRSVAHKFMLKLNVSQYFIPLQCWLVYRCTEKSCDGKKQTFVFISYPHHFALFTFHTTHSQHYFLHRSTSLDKFFRSVFDFKSHAGNIFDLIFFFLSFRACYTLCRSGNKLPYNFSREFHYFLQLCATHISTN